MALLTYADDDNTVKRLVDAVTGLAEAHAGKDPIEPPAPVTLRDLQMETVMLPREAFLGRTETVPWREAAGRVSAEMICPYPPGIPVVAPGERLREEVVDYLQVQAASGVMVEGAGDETLASFRVVAQ
jgi:arginine/lysine/ornithine decarboxylase